MLSPGATAYRGVTLRYGMDPERLGPLLASRAQWLDADPATRAWIDDALEHPHGGWAMAARGALSKLMSDYDANGLLGTHDMRVLGSAQWRTLLGDRLHGRLLDVGAGDGHVTAELTGAMVDMSSVVTTELSPKMAARLRERGFRCHELDLATQALPEPGPFDVIAMLNVLDRSARPLTLLERLRELLAPRGRLLLAVPLPLSPHVHVGPLTLEPDERLPLDDRSFEHAARTLAELCFEPLGLEVCSLSRAPYLCRGSSKRPVVVLDDSVFVLARRGER
ncbi:MAG: methyltransferase domain-containing protein [Deltaproteobacteria bacterium]|nr:methyltransferase domain-containing protein [Deltaproteobacteria bacterium]